MLISAVHKHVRKKWLIYLASNEFKATKYTNLIFLTEKLNTGHPTRYTKKISITIKSENSAIETDHPDKQK